MLQQSLTQEGYFFLGNNIHLNLSKNLKIFLNVKDFR